MLEQELRQLKWGGVNLWKICTLVDKLCDIITSQSHNWWRRFSIVGHCVIKDSSLFLIAFTVSAGFVYISKERSWYGVLILEPIWQTDIHNWSLSREIGEAHVSSSGQKSLGQGVEHMWKCASYITHSDNILILKYLLKIPFDWRRVCVCFG